MARLTALNPEEVTGKTKDLFNAVQAKLGVVPNMMRTMGNSPAVLEGYLNLSGALSHGKLSAKTGELIALAVSESNSCDYCLVSSHFYWRKIGKS
ncbi:carboxymuconolactone decarboxylase family protein [Flavobacterium sp. P21]|uniref:carboxymuconolactone decarboxylase family protein n=1 Tax=Flavobacterium sp. P21 TaxID=3423948 RepID=UPI003D668945